MENPVDLMKAGPNWGRTYTDDELVQAVANSQSWRGVLRALGLAGTSPRSVRQHVDRLGLDHSHFTGQRRWTDPQLTAALSDARSWQQVSDRLGLKGGSCASGLKGHARRLGLDVTHLDPVPMEEGTKAPCGPGSLQYLSRTGSLLAAAWFSLRGCEVAWPLEPCPFDLIATFEERPQRIQVKTTQQRAGATWALNLSTSRRGRVAYDPDEIDCFFGIDGEFRYYLIPVAVVGGLRTVHLAAYAAYRLGDLLPAA